MIVQCGREITDNELEQICETVETFSNLSLTELVEEPGICYKQRPFSDSSVGQSQVLGKPGIGQNYQRSGTRLGGALGISAGSAGDLCRSATLSRDMLPGCQFPIKPQ